MIENVRRQVARRDEALDGEVDERPPNTLDQEPAKKRLRQLEEWLEVEHIRQGPNRYQMAIDEDFYDNLQISQEDMDAMIERGQAPLVYNKIAPAVRWVTGTEKRTRIDFKVFPRSSNDRDGAENKTKVLKYLSDVNKSQYSRSRAFADAVKVGVGWLEGGVRSDPTKSLIFDRYESWRNLIYDSHGVESDLSDGRYIFRRKQVDLDISELMFPERVDVLRSGASYSELLDAADSDFWYMGQRMSVRGPDGLASPMGSRNTFVDSSASFVNRRARVKLIEAWYRMPQKVKLLTGGGMNGSLFDPNDDYHVWLAQQKASSVIERVSMRVRCAVFIRGSLLQDVISPYRHNEFPFTPIWGNRRGIDNAPYGMIRAMRDPQEDFNKRMSKALFSLSTRRITMDKDAHEDKEELREEAARPDAILEFKAGSKYEMHTDVEIAEAHIEYARIDERMIQDSSGVSDELMGRKTNAVSGKAIEARQDQGSTVTTDYFDALRLAVQLHGQKQLSLSEQFMTDEQDIRIIGERSGYDFLTINKPVVDKDTGQPTLLNDITKDQADFIVSAQDFRESAREAAYDKMMEMVTKLPPEIAIKLLDDVLEFADLPGAEQLIQTIREINGKPPRDKKLTPEEEQQIAQAKQAEQAKQAAAEKLAFDQAQATVAELVAKVNKLNAEAEKIKAEAGGLGADSEARRAMDEQVQKIREDTAKLVTGLTDQVREAQQKAADRTAEIESKAKTDIELAAKDVDAKVKIAAIQAEAELAKAKLDAESREKIAAIQADETAKLEALQGELAILRTELQVIGAAKGEAEGKVKQLADAADKKVVQAAAAKETAAKALAPPVVVVPPQPEGDDGDRTKRVQFDHAPDGKMTGFTISETRSKKPKPTKPVKG